jgi:abortive infection bacteriophage resistance protein
MKYEKEVLTFAAQADLLLSRGLEADRDKLIRRLEAISYYRLSGYLYPFRVPESDNFQPGTHLRTVWDRYCFDRRLRVLVLDAIERIEVSLRTKVVYQFVHVKVAGEYGFPDELIRSWLRSLNAARNTCAHHARFWNRVFGYPPLLPNPNKFPDWHGEDKLKQDKFGVLLMICRHLLQLISQTSHWHERIESLFAEYPEIPVTEMGLPENWKEHPVWNPSSSQ